MRTSLPDLRPDLHLLLTWRVLSCRLITADELYGDIGCFCGCFSVLNQVSAASVVQQNAKCIRRGFYFLCPPSHFGKLNWNVVFCIRLQHENCYCDLTDVTQVQPLRTPSRRLDTNRCWTTGRKVTSDGGRPWGQANKSWAINQSVVRRVSSYKCKTRGAFSLCCGHVTTESSSTATCWRSSVCCDGHSKQKLFSVRGLDFWFKRGRKHPWVWDSGLVRRTVRLPWNRAVLDLVSAAVSCPGRQSARSERSTSKAVNFGCDSSSWRRPATETTGRRRRRETMTRGLWSCSSFIHSHKWESLMSSSCRWAHTCRMTVSDRIMAPPTNKYLNPAHWQIIKYITPLHPRLQRVLKPTASTARNHHLQPETQTDLHVSNRPTNRAEGGRGGHVTGRHGVLLVFLLDVVVWGEPGPRCWDQARQRDSTPGHLEELGEHLEEEEEEEVTARS